MRPTFAPHKAPGREPGAIHVLGPTPKPESRTVTYHRIVAGRGCACPQSTVAHRALLRFSKRSDATGFDLVMAATTAYLVIGGFFAAIMILLPSWWLLETPHPAASRTRRATAKSPEPTCDVSSLVAIW